MSERSAENQAPEETLPLESQQRRDFLQGLGKWSAASVMAAVGTAAWLAGSGNASAGWINRRGGWINGGGGWINAGGGGGWINRRGGGGWLNRR
ncbi:MAG: hypothetical protein WBE58_00050 [Verrucomicrobiales bacterium]|nr:hypothetical protein [Verrucomicrobiales bacterium]